MVFPLRRLLPWCKLSSTPFILCKLTNSLLNMHSSNNFVVVVRFALLAFLRIVLNSNLDCAKPSLASTQPYILKAGRSVYNFACSTAASIDYKFEFTIRNRASNSVHFELHGGILDLDLLYSSIFVLLLRDLLKVRSKNQGRAPWSCGLIHHVLDWKVGGLNLGKSESFSPGQRFDLPCLFF